MSHKNTVKTRRAKENSAILEETQWQCTVGRRSLVLCTRSKECLITQRSLKVLVTSWNFQTAEGSFRLVMKTSTCGNLLTWPIVGPVDINQWTFPLSDRHFQDRRTFDFKNLFVTGYSAAVITLPNALQNENQAPFAIVSFQFEKWTQPLYSKLRYSELISLTIWNFTDLSKEIC